MTYHVFDLLYVEPDQVREFLISMAKEGLVGGVYLWINRVNGNMYVGSSINLCTRIRGYLILSNLHGIIGRALLKHGLDSFILVIFFVPNATSSLVLALEQSVLDGSTCAYNILPTAGSRAGSKHSEETKEKMSAKHKGHKHSEETKDKISASRLNMAKAVYLYVVHPYGFELSSIHLSTPRLVEFLGIPRSTLYRYIKNRSVFQVNGVSYIASWDGNLS